MDSFDVHFIMLLLGLVAGVSVNGSKFFKLSAAGWRRAHRSSTQQRILGILAFLIVALSPLIRLLRDSLTGIALLQQAFLVAAIGLLGMLLYALLQQPYKRRVVSHTAGNTIKDSTAAININADAIPQMGYQADALDTDITHVVENAQGLGLAANDHEQQPASTQTAGTDSSFMDNLDHLIAQNSLSQDEMDDDSTLIADVDLPDSEEWLAAIDDSVNLDESIVLADEHIATPTSQPEQAITEGELLSDEVFAETEQATELVVAKDAATDDSTANYELLDSLDHLIPSTLADVLEMGSNHAVALQQDIDDLKKKLADLQQVHEQLNKEQQQAQLASAQMIINREQLLESESKTRHAAEGVITAQRAVIDRSKLQQTLYSKMLRRERTRLVGYKEEVARSKTMARQAAALARKAAIANQSVRDIAKREQQARMKSQESAKKAVDIARNAISALAAEERKNASGNYFKF